MKFAIIGAGPVGVSTAIMLGALGHGVTLVDLDMGRVNTIRAGRAPFRERGIDDALKYLKDESRLWAVPANTPKADKVFTGSDATFLCVGTPQLLDGPDQDLSAVRKATDQWLSAMVIPGGDSPRTTPLLIIRSTVLPGTCERVYDEMNAKHGDPMWDLAHMPEFVAEGNVVKDALRPSKIVLGCDHATMDSLPVLDAISKAPRGSSPVVISGSLRDAEMAKYACNFALAARLSMVNEVAAYCSAFGANVDMVLDAMKADPRIGDRYITPGAGWGGSCFPKDLSALLGAGNDLDLIPSMVAATIVRNDEASMWPVRMVEKFALADKRIGVWGSAFKPGTDDVRNSPALPIIEWLSARCPNVGVHDPRASVNTTRWARANNIDLLWASGDDPLRTARDVDILFVLTGWNAYKQFPPTELALSGVKLVVDGRNLWDPADFVDTDVGYISFGRRPVGLVPA